MAVTAKEIAKQVPNAGSGKAIIEGAKVVLRKTESGPMVWAKEEDGVWKVFDDVGDATTPQQTAPEIARELVRRFSSLP